MEANAEQLQLVVLLLLGIVVVAPLTRRIGFPVPVVVMVFGALVGLVPGVPRLEIPPALILPLVLPPLLFAAARRTTARAFAADALPIGLLAVGLVLLTTAVVAVAAHALAPELSWAEAVVLGAVVSPPDPVAATSLAGRLPLPPSLVSILEGEGLFNDGLALVLYNLAVAAAITGTFSVGKAALELLLVVVGGVVLGLGLGWGGRRLLAWLADPDAESVLTLVLPYGAYLVAEAVSASGVLAVLASGLYLSEWGVGATSAAGRLLGRGFWTVTEFMISSLAFALVGLELTTVVVDQGGVTGTDVSVALVIGALVVILRPAWIFAVRPLVAKARRAAGRPPPDARAAALLAWAGMRGVVTVATALALPALDPGAARHTIVTSALAVVALTLLLQGLSLPVVARRLRVRAEFDPERVADELRARISQEAMAELDRRVEQEGVAPEVAEDVRERITLPPRFDLPGDSEEQARRRLEAARNLALDLLQFERDRLIELRRAASVDAAAVDEVLLEVSRRLERN